MYSLPPSIEESIQNQLSVRVQGIQAVSGGSINEAFRLDTSKGDFFLKYNRGNFAGSLFAAEAKSLALLETVEGIRTPMVILQESSAAIPFLLLEFVEEGLETVPFWKNFGRSLANLHRQTQPLFGLAESNFIGRLPQSNGFHESWSDFYREERILPQINLARKKKLLQPNDLKAFDLLFLRSANLFPIEPPALVHGDLWSGNFLAATNEEPVLIDPAASYAHREMDLAMTHLFGGFSPVFYAAYQEVYPLAPNFEDRIGWYQLYYLLVHLNLFGVSYLPSIQIILKKLNWVGQLGSCKT